MTRNPAEMFGLRDRGKLEEGCIADITLIDPKKKWKVDGSMLETKCKWSPFEGMELTGKAHTVVKSGKLLYHKYKLLV